MTILGDCTNSTLTDCIYSFIQSAVATGIYGNTGTAYLLLYSLFVVSAIAVFTIFRNSFFWGLLAGIMVHLIIMVLGTMSVIPLPSTYFVVGNIMSVGIVLLLIMTWKRNT